MIRLNRTRTEAAIDPVFRGLKRIEYNKKLIREELEVMAGVKKKHEWDSSIWGRSKEQLLIESNNKCAYCDAPLKVVAYGDVEHYRPKSIYWWLAYCYENYLVSCTLCNQAYKKDKFRVKDKKKRLQSPVEKKDLTNGEIDLLAPALNPDPFDDTAGMPLMDFFALHSNEDAFLVNPYYEEPEEILEYSVDPVKKEVEVRVNPDCDNAQHIFDAIVTDYGLNRLELKQLRYEWYDLYYTHKLVSSENSVSAALKTRARQKIEDLKQDKAPFAGMIRYFEK